MMIDWKEEFLKMKEYAVALEHTRTDLMGRNEELRLKIEALERGSLELQIVALSICELEAKECDELSNNDPEGAYGWRVCAAQARCCAAKIRERFGLVGTL